MLGFDYFLLIVSVTFAFVNAIHLSLNFIDERVQKIENLFLDNLKV